MLSMGSGGLLRSEMELVSVIPHSYQLPAKSTNTKKRETRHRLTGITFRCALSLHADRNERTKLQ
jgi:hypothetical protein